MESHNELSKIISKKVSDLLAIGDVLPIYIFSGNISYNTMDAHLIELKSNLKFSIENSQLRKRMYSVLVEGLDNIYRHGYPSSSKLTNNAPHGFLIITQKDNIFFISLGNFIEKRHISSFNKKLDCILKKTKTELNFLIKEQMDKVVYSRSGHAGIGLMDIARKVNGNGNISYIFEDCNESLSIHTLNISFINKTQS